MQISDFVILGGESAVEKWKAVGVEFVAVGLVVVVVVGAAVSVLATMMLSRHSKEEWIRRFKQQSRSILRRDQGAAAPEPEAGDEINPVTTTFSQIWQHESRAGAVYLSAEELADEVPLPVEEAERVLEQTVEDIREHLKNYGESGKTAGRASENAASEGGVAFPALESSSTGSPNLKSPSLASPGIGSPNFKSFELKRKTIKDKIESSKQIYGKTWMPKTSMLTGTNSAGEALPARDNESESGEVTLPPPPFPPVDSPRN